MKQNTNSMNQRAGRMLRAAWKTLKQALFMRMVRTDSPSQRAVVTACGPMPLWSGGLACAGLFQ